MEKAEQFSRIKKIFSYLSGIDVIILLNTETMDPNFLYLTGFTSGLYEYSYLIVERQKITLFTSSLEYETAVEAAPEGMEIIKMDPTVDFRSKISSIIKDKKIGMNEFFIPHGLYKLILKRYQIKKTTDVSTALSKARLVKDENEIGSIKKAVSITKWALLMIQKSFKEGMTEKELASKFDQLSASLGSSGPSFETIVCFGKNAALPHHFPDDTKLKKGDFILIDAGAKIDNYCSDMTRTFIFAEPNDTADYKAKTRMMKVVKDAQLRAIRSIKPGVKGSVIHKIAQEYIDTIDDGFYKGRFIHALGHSLGIEVHDGAGFSPGANQLLKPGMIITAEPGIYIPGFGGVRIEDDILITKDGAEVL